CYRPRTNHPHRRRSRLSIARDLRSQLVSAGACSRGHAREASRSGWPLPRTRDLLFSSLSLRERRMRSASEGKELLASEFGAGIGARDAKLVAATTILGHCTR